MNINKNNKNIKIFLPIFIAVLFATNALTLYLYKKSLLAGCGTHFINPIFACGKKNIVDKKGYVELKTRLQEFIQNKEDEGKADLIAVWFRDLEAGPTFGINDRRDFIPASLLKLPLALAYFSLAEDNSAMLSRKYAYTELVEVPEQTFLPSETIQTGKAYTVDELIYHMLVQSDNKSAQLLYEHIEKFYPGELSVTYRDLGILEPGNNLNMSAVNTKGYGSIFRMLYNASFLNVEMSEKLLSMLAQSEFNDGLKAGVPADMVVAHKFGERFLEDGTKQLHDCGIIYYPGNPYQLCIMTIGTDFVELSGIIAEISKQVYEEFDSRKIK